MIDGSVTAVKVICRFTIGGSGDQLKSACAAAASCAMGANVPSASRQEQQASQGNAPDASGMWSLGETGQGLHRHGRRLDGFMHYPVRLGVRGAPVARPPI